MKILVIIIVVVIVLVIPICLMIFCKSEKPKSDPRGRDKNPILDEWEND